MVGASGVGTPGKRWFCVHTKRGMEKIASVNLVRQGFETFFPRHRRTIGNARRAGKAGKRSKASVREAPLFNGYIFVRFDPVAVRWKRVNHTLGVNSLVMQGPTPVPVPPGVVDALRAMCDAPSTMRGAPSAMRAAGNAGARDDSARDEARADEPAAIDARHMNAHHAGMLKGVEELGERDRLRVLFDILRRPQPQGFAGGVR